MTGPASPLQVWLVESVRRTEFTQTELATRAGLTQKHDERTTTTD